MINQLAHTIQRKGINLLKPLTYFAPEMTVTNNDMPNDLLGKYLNGEATPAEIAQAEEWINSSDANRHYYAQLKINIESDKNIAHNKEAWVRLQNRINKNHSGRINKPDRKVKTRWVQLIASIALLCLIGYIIRLGLYSESNITLNSDANTLAQTLPDGTTVRLNPHSKLSYPVQFTGDKRTVSLTGEAYFKVRADSAKLFAIILKEININTASATILVKNRNSKTQITVETGKAEVSTPTNRLLLKPGEIVNINRGDVELIKPVSGADKIIPSKDSN